MSHTKWQWEGHLFTYVKPVKEVALKILYNGPMYITRFFSGNPDDRDIMESQCIKNKMDSFSYQVD